jgi:hypothetical protein
MRSQRVLTLGVVAVLAAGLRPSDVLRVLRSRPMSDSRRRAARVAVAALLLAATGAGAAVPAGASAPAGETAAWSARAARTTSLTLTVHGCDGCTIQPVRAGNGTTVPVWRGKTKKVRNGSAHWKVTIRHTVGMSFDINDPDAVNIGVMPDIVVAYRGLAVGDRVPAGVAKHKKKANGCWSGTHKAQVNLRVRVERFRATSAFPPPVKGFSIRPYFVRTRAHLRISGGRMYTRTFHGAIGNQDAFFCDM